MTNKLKEVIVVGGGLAGLSAIIKLCEKGCLVKLISLVPARRSHSVCAQGGMNAAIDSRQEGDSPLIHAFETIKAGDFLANQPPVLEMCLTAPSIVRMFDRMGCPFNRTEKGTIEQRRFGGSLYHRTVFCGASTGQQLLYSLDEQVRRYEVQGLVKRFEHHEFLRLILDEKGCAFGIVLHDLYDLNVFALKADAVVMATGGLGNIYKKSTNSTFCTGAASGRLYMQGAKYANGEFIQIHPTSIAGSDKMRLISESSRGEGGRIWVFGDSSRSIRFPDHSMRPCGTTGEPWYFLEEMYPAYGNLVPRDVGSREIIRICEMGLGVDGGSQVYLDVTHLSSETQRKLQSALDLYEKFVGVNPRKQPMKIYPAVHYSMGGIWVDWPAADDEDRKMRYRQMTNLEGCFNAGESDYQYHGANRLGANSLLSCVFAGLVVGGEVFRFLCNQPSSDLSSIDKIVQEAVQREKQEQAELLQRKGSENIYRLHDELAEEMLSHVSVKRDNQGLSQAIAKIQEIRERFAHVTLSDGDRGLNQTYVFAKQFRPMLEIALVIAKGALQRNEFRGAHFKPEFPKRDDKSLLKTTIANFLRDQSEPLISYEPVDDRHVDLEPRNYEKTYQGIPEIKRIPSKMELPL